MTEKYEHIPEIALPNTGKFDEMLKNDCISVTYKKYKSFDSDSVYIAGINEDGLICPEDIHTGIVGKKGRGYGGSTIDWELDDGEKISLRGPSRCAPQYIIQDTAVEKEDIKPSPFMTILYLREVRPWSDPIRRRTGQLWRYKYIHADKEPRYEGKDKSTRELVKGFFKKYPDVYEVCHEELRPYGGGSGCFHRRNFFD